MRSAFNEQLAALRQELITLYTDVDLEVHEAVEALLNRDSNLAKSIYDNTRQIDKRCASLEDDAYNLIVLQQPVASDLRLLQFIIYVNFNLARMSNHTRNLAKCARRISGKDVPQQLLDLLAKEAQLVYRVLGSTIEAIVEGNLEIASSLVELDEPVDVLYEQFYKTFAKLGSDVNMDAATQIIMSARMLERISDNAVEMGGRLVFLLTGKRRNLVQIAQMNDDEINNLYAVRGVGLTRHSDKDAQIIEAIPEVNDRANHEYNTDSTSKES